MDNEPDDFGEYLSQGPRVRVVVQHGGVAEVRILVALEDLESRQELGESVLRAFEGALWDSFDRVRPPESSLPAADPERARLEKVINDYAAGRAPLGEGPAVSREGAEIIEVNGVRLSHDGGLPGAFDLEEAMRWGSKHELERDLRECLNALLREVWSRPAIVVEPLTIQQLREFSYSIEEAKMGVWG